MKGQSYVTLVASGTDLAREQDARVRTTKSFMAVNESDSVSLVVTFLFIGLGQVLACFPACWVSDS